MVTSTTGKIVKLYSLRGFSRLTRGVVLQARRMASFDKTTYSSAESAEIDRWLTTSENLKSDRDHAEVLDTLNAHLASRTTLLGVKASKADVALYQSLAPQVSKWTPDQRTGEHGHPHIVRHLDFVQNSPLFGVDLPDSEKIKIDADEILYVKPPVDAKAEKERLKKEKAAAGATATAGQNLPDRSKEKGEKDDKELIGKAADQVANAKQAVISAVTSDKTPKKEKKEKTPKPPKAPAAAAPLSPCLIDLRVGHILKAIQHPEAEKLYVSTIAMGDKAGTDDTEEYQGQIVRTVCSGLNGLVPLEEMQGRKVVVVCNLKPVKMRGIKSAAMVLAASPRAKEGEEGGHGGPVELVAPPEGAVAGERVFFEGWKGEPEGILNPKKKVWEIIQPGFTTTESLEVAFDAAAVKELQKEGEISKAGIGKLVTESGGVCKVKTLSGAVVR